MAKDPRYLKEPGKVLHESFQKIDRMYFDEQKGDPVHTCGSTCVAITIIQGNVHCSWAGDSRAVLSTNGKAKDLSIDHKPKVPSETKRIEEAGGFVSVDDGAVCGMFGVSRAIGDYMMKDFKGDYVRKLCKNKEGKFTADLITAEPESSLHRIDPMQDEFVIMATDGVWDKVTSQEAVTFVRDKLMKNPAQIGQAAQALCDAAIKAHSQDNCAAVIIVLGDFVAKKDTNTGVPLTSLAGLNQKMETPYNPATDDRTATAALPREEFEELTRQMKAAGQLDAPLAAKAEANGEEEKKS